MVFIGPRPVLKEEACYIDEWHFKVKPGLTGPTQIKRGQKISLKEYNQLDKEFVTHPRPFVRDLQILLKTFLVVFKGV
jgi:lipopolysaccharide/colanic/teichoic acid biosynthesis glycosyltransferase